MTRPLW